MRQDDGHQPPNVNVSVNMNSGPNSGANYALSLFLRYLPPITAK